MIFSVLLLILLKHHVIDTHFKTPISSSSAWHVLLAHTPPLSLLYHPPSLLTNRPPSPARTMTSLALASM